MEHDPPSSNRSPQPDDSLPPDDVPEGPSSDSMPRRPAFPLDARLLEAVPDQLPGLVYVLDPGNNRLIYVNRRSREVLGHDPEQLRGTDYFATQVHADDKSRLADAASGYDSLPPGEVLELACRVRHADGQWRWIQRREVVLQRDASGAAIQILGIAEDVTDRKSGQRHLLRDHERMLSLLAYDIHDGFVQDVVGAQMALESIIETIGEGQPDCMQELILMRGLLRKAIGEGRRMITELRPMIIDEMGVVEAVHYLIGEEEAAERLRIEFQHDVEFDRLAPMLEGTVFRIVQESLNNIRRHADVDQAEVRLTQSGGRLQVEIEDHGCGFDIAAVKDHHYGLEGIRERARLFGGRATIRSSPGEGTLISVTLPTELPPEWRERGADREPS